MLLLSIILQIFSRRQFRKTRTMAPRKSSDEKPLNLDYFKVKTKSSKTIHLTCIIHCTTNKPENKVTTAYRP